MAEVREFRGIRYNEEKTGDLSLVVAPPYDVIDEELQELLYNQSRYGIVRIDYGKVEYGDDEDENRYTRASYLFREWRREGIFKQDREPSLYYVEEDYKGESGVLTTRCGFLGAVRVKDAESGVYRPHEKTLAGPKADRLSLTHACKANLSPVFSLYDDPDSLIDTTLEAWKSSAGEPVARVRRPDGFEIRMWRIVDDKVIGIVQEVMKDKSFYIADGHHRYETALNYKNEMRAANPGFTTQEPWNFTLMYLVNMHSPGLKVLPTHRAVFGLAGFDGHQFISKLSAMFDVLEIKGELSELHSSLKALRGKEQALGMAINGDPRLFLVKPRQDYDPDRELPSKTPALRTLDVTMLHSLIIERILEIDERAQEEQRNLSYVKDAGDLLQTIREGKADIGFFLNPTPVESVKNAAEAGERMPQKSTFFYPKLVTGLVINPLE